MENFVSRPNKFQRQRIWFQKFIVKKMKPRNIPIDYFDMEDPVKTSLSKKTLEKSRLPFAQNITSYISGVNGVRPKVEGHYIEQKNQNQLAELSL